jgi:hypothetical protein
MVQTSGWNFNIHNIFISFREHDYYWMMIIISIYSTSLQIYINFSLNLISWQHYFALSDLWLLLTWFWCWLKDVNEPLSQLITQVLFGLPKGVSHFMYEPLDHFF